MSDTDSPAAAIALVGCGAIAEAFHLPALARHKNVRERLILVDPAQDRARELADRHGVRETCGDLTEVLDRIDGAIVAVPPHLHHPVSLACLERGVHVLCEKPLCDTSEAARELVATAEQTRASLCVNQTRRLFPAFGEVRQLVAEGAIGRPTRLHYTMGEPFDWPAATDSYFGARGSRKGVLLDTGAHIVDLVMWWLGGEATVLDYRDDSAGGTEAVAHLELDVGGCRASIHLSWLSKLDNSYRIEGTEGALAGEAYEWASYTRTDRAGRPRKVRTRERPKGFEDIAQALVDDFLAVVSQGTPPRVPGSDVLPAIEIIDTCYRRREESDTPSHFEQTWLEASPGLA
jgi:predicted dehydrogenase